MTQNKKQTLQQVTDQTTNKLPPFEDTIAFQILAKRWGGIQDMEKYFQDKSKEHLVKLQQETKR